VVPAAVGGLFPRGLAAVTDKPVLLRSLADRDDALLHYIPLLRKAVAMADDPQKHEDEHVKEVKKKTGAQ
jgi:hypothetical protein